MFGSESFHGETTKITAGETAMGEAMTSHGGIDGSLIDIFKGVVTKKYADFDGRARRREYWMFYLGAVLVYLGLFILAVILGQINSTLGAIMFIPMVLFALAILIPTLAVGVRRLHDTGKPTWMIVFTFLPLLNLVFLVFMILDSDKGTNEFGPSPKYGA